ncbi:hypothetical protein PVAND_002974 [Polypedilum vanderplanki]|uniref:Cuticular protein n=1 Tax=Polypedilum vanderplanki TaxID=319348 RepID=A0A9J6BUB6_POLVA|nr:hypothetical protein PVAND_002974 [Polypedilum vanderplanki]
MAFKFVLLCASLAMANAGLIAEPAITYNAAPVVSKTIVQPAVAYAQHAPVHSSSYTKTLSYTAPKAYSVAAAPAIATYSHYEPEHHHYAAAPSVAYHHEPVVAKTVIAQPHYEHGHSEQNIVRSAHGTVSQISKAVDTPTSSVRKYDTRIINDGIKTVSYAQPTAYVSQPATYVSQPATTTYVHQPAQVVQKTIVSQPAVAYAQHAPTHYVSQPVAYAQHAPVVHAAKVHYSPAVEVAHVNFESPLAHYGW